MIDERGAESERRQRGGPSEYYLDGRFRSCLLHEGKSQPNTTTRNARGG